MPFIEGFLIGLGMAIFIGPVFFTLLQTTLQFGKVSGIAVATGIILSDVLCVLIFTLGLNKVGASPEVMNWSAGIGAIILTVLGLKYIFKPNLTTQAKLPKSINIAGSFLNGFLVNFVNPFVFVVWAGVYIYTKEKYPSEMDQYISLSGVLLGILSTDLAKVFLADKIRPLLKPTILMVTFKVIGLVLLIFAVRLLLYLF